MQELELRADKPREYRLGHEIEFKGGRALVTRIVSSTAVFETAYLRYAVTELYVELLTELRKIEFVILDRNRTDLPRPQGTRITAPEPILWKDEDQRGVNARAAGSKEAENGKQ